MKKYFILFFIVFFMLNFINSSFAKDEIYEKDGCIYIVGHPMQEGIKTNADTYNERIAKRKASYETEIQRIHEIKIEKIRAEAVKVYAKYLEVLYKERTNAIKRNQRGLRGRRGKTGIQGETGVTGTTGGSGAIVTDPNEIDFYSLPLYNPDIGEDSGDLQEGDMYRTDGGFIKIFSG